ncbi:MAG: hypothetical protein QXV17_05970 [Candidatus Micrarchaeaceae archaeon]
MVEKIKNGGGDAEAIGKEKEIAEAEKALRNLFSLYDSWDEIESKVDDNRDKKIDDIVSVVFPPDKKKLIMSRLNSEFNKKYSEDVIDKALKNIVGRLVLGIEFSSRLAGAMLKLYERQ